MSARAKLNLTRPSAAAPALRVSRPAALVEHGESRLVVQLPTEEHQAVKVTAAQRGLSIRDYVRGLLERDGAFRA